MHQDPSGVSELSQSQSKSAIAQMASCCGAERAKTESSHAQPWSLRAACCSQANLRFGALRLWRICAWTRRGTPRGRRQRRREGIVRRGAGGGDPRAIGWMLRANCRARKGQPLTRANCRGRAPPPTSADRARVGGGAHGADRGRGQGARARCFAVRARCCFAEGDVLNVYQRKSRTTAGWLCPCPVLV